MIHTKVTLAALAIAILSAVPLKADLVGETIELSRHVTYVPLTQGPFPYTVGSSAPVALTTGNNLYGSASGTDLFLTFGPGRGGPDLVPAFYDFVLFDNLFAGTSTQITGLSFETDLPYVPGLPEFGQSNLVFTSHSVEVGLGGVLWSGGQTLEITLQTSSVPEPSESMAIVIVVGVLGLISRRRNRSFNHPKPIATLTFSSSEPKPNY